MFLRSQMLYTIVEQFNPEQMSEAVGELLDDGWSLHGNLLLVTYRAEDGEIQAERHRTIYVQAMTKEESPADLKARKEYFTNLLAKPVDQLTPEERKDREDYIELMSNGGLPNP
jgi:hypothetical protein